MGSLHDSSTNVRPVLEGALDLTAGEPQLLASKCSSCGTYFFPRTTRCANPTCLEAKVEDARLSRNGSLASYTVVRYTPPPPYQSGEPFVPFVLGEVAFPEGIQVAGPVEGVELDKVSIGMIVKTDFSVYQTSEDGPDVIGWSFSPAERAGPK